jgi:hypothetical protein
MTARAIHRWLLPAVMAVSVVGCEDPPRLAALDASTSASASRVPPPPPPPQREGCARSGAMSGIESEPSCLVKKGNEDAMRAALKQLTITLDPEPSEVVGGGTSLLALTIKNTSAFEATLFLEARPRAPGLRTDWSRVVGIPEPHPAASEVPRLLFPMTTTDSYDRDVDALPTVPGSGATPQATIFAVHLRPGAKLTHNLSWWALRIPAPAPIVTDDAGHRYIPKTTAQILSPGEYNVTVDLPFHGLSREERKIVTRLRVTRTPLPDGGLRRAF